MKSNASSLALFVCLALAAPTSGAQWWNPVAPKNYEDCILKEMKGVASDDAALAVAAACRRKFPIWCEVYWEDGRFKKGTKPLFGGYQTWQVQHDKSGAKVRIHIPQSMMPKSEKDEQAFVMGKMEQIVKVCNM